MEMIFFLSFLLVLVLVDLAAVRWGKDSTEPVNSSEWEHRQDWEYSL